MKKLYIILTLYILDILVSAAYTQSRVEFNNQQLFLSGANFAWRNFARDIGPGSTDFEYFQSIFQDVHENGGNSMRLWLHTTGASTPAFDATGKVTDPGENTKLRKLSTPRA